ncbi:MAG: LysM peptidoglycan-binding domain-containing protein [Bdellovibrionales bacterium]
MLRKSRGLLLPCLFLLTGCASLLHNPNSSPEAQSSAAAADGENVQSAEIKENEESSEVVEHNIEMPYKSAFGDVPLDNNDHVEKWMKYFTGRGRKYMQLYLERSARYLPMMRNVLRENGLPEELVYVAMIESGFSPKAHSHANAVGYWQFIRGTGKRFGLKIDTFIDERRDPVLSTRAAAEYFKALHNLLGSWHLAMAAYNVGEARVKRAVTKYYTRDFWALIKKRRALPPETRNYVPKFIAAVMIAKDPARYGFTALEFQDPLSYDTVALQSPISISKLASNLNVDIEELQLLNPKFRTDYVPITRGTETVVRIPVGRATDALAALSMSVTSTPKVVQAEYYYYRIRRGDNLSTIAKRHRTTVSQLRRLNGLSNRTLLRIGRKLRVPDVGGEGVKYVMEDANSNSNSSYAVPAVERREVSVHTVRPGENLSIIAKRYGISVADLIELNNLSKRATIYKGQKLKLKSDNQSSTGTRVVKKRSQVLSKYKSRSATKRVVRKELPNQRGKRSAAQSNRRRHVVKRGETLWDLAKKYDISLSRLARANGLRVNTRVMAGQRLAIPD